MLEHKVAIGMLPEKHWHSDMLNMSIDSMLWIKAAQTRLLSE